MKSLAQVFERTLELKTTRRVQLVEITHELDRIVASSGVTNGLCVAYVPHTTAGLLINENADPDVAADIEATLERLVPRAGSYRHAEGNADAHIRSVLTGVSQVLLVAGGRLRLGRWQGVFFCEFDGPRRREVWVKILGDGT
jgi:secondary thiamine-phosphate synthase enzyme